MAHRVMFGNSRGGLEPVSLGEPPGAEMEGGHLDPRIVWGVSG